MWKKSEILKNKKFRILLLLEVLLLLVPVIGILCGNKTISTLADAQVTTEEGVIREAKGYSVDGSSNISGPWLEMSGFSMAPGTYCYYVTYDTDDNGVNKINITSDGEIYRELLENELSLYSGRTESSCEIYVTSRLKADEVNIHADYYGTGKLTIKDIRLVKTTASYRMLLVMFLLGFLLLDSLIMLYVYMENILLRWRRNWYTSEFPHWRSWLPYRYLWIILWWEPIWDFTCFVLNSWRRAWYRESFLRE